MNRYVSKVFALWLLASLPIGSACAAPAFRSVAIDARGETLSFDAPGIDADGLRVRVLLPPDYDPASALGYAVLYVNDGQDADAVALRPWLDALIVSGEIAPVIAVAIDMPKDRMGAYGFSDRAAQRSLIAPLRVGAIGTQAHAYSEWVAKTLVPAIDARYRTRARSSAGRWAARTRSTSAGNIPKSSRMSAHSRRRCGCRRHPTRWTASRPVGSRRAWSPPGNIIPDRNSSSRSAMPRTTSPRF